MCTEYLWGAETVKGSISQLKNICFRTQVDKKAKKFKPTDEFFTQVGRPQITIIHQNKSFCIN